MIQVFATPRNGQSRRLVVLRNGRDEYRDSIDTDSGFQRQQLLERAAVRFDLAAEELLPLDGEIVKQADAEDEREEGQQDHRPIRFQRISCAELDAASYSLEYLIDDALVAGQPCIVAGGKKTLKTSLVIDLGISLAMGGCFLGKLKVNRACRVGIMSGESGLATIQETARRIAQAAGYRLSDIGGLVFSENLPQFGDTAHEEALRRFIMDDEIEVLGIDPAYMSLGDVDAANYFAMGQRLRGVSEVCREAGALFLLAAHTKKTKVDPFSPPELEDIAWAGFQEFFRQWLLVGRRERYQPGTGEHRLWLSAGGSAGHSDFWAVDINEGTRKTPGGRFWEVKVLRADEARQQAQDHKEAEQQTKREEAIERDCERVKRALAKYPAGETPKRIRETAGVNPARFNLAIARLIERCEVLPCELTKSNRRTPYDAYRLAE